MYIMTPIYDQYMHEHLPSVILSYFIILITFLVKFVPKPTVSQLIQSYREKLELKQCHITMILQRIV